MKHFQRFHFLISRKIVSIQVVTNKGKEASLIALRH